MSSKAESTAREALDWSVSSDFIRLLGRATSFTASENSLEPGKIYKGRVSGVNMSLRAMTVSIGRQRLENCIFAAGELASFFGLGEYGMPMLGAEVSVLYSGPGSPSVVIGTTGSLHPAVKTGRPSLTGCPDKNKAGKEKAFTIEEKDMPSTIRKGMLPPIDLLPGEMCKTNGLGPAVKLLYNFATLSASDCAKVEACILNDMVRIVDNYFVHHTCGGDELVWTTGNVCNGEEHFTGVLFEAEGKEKADDPLAKDPLDEFNYDVDKSVDKPFSDTGRWRMSRYWGFLGDMIHQWVTNPTKVTSNIMEGAFRTGQYRSWVGSDGTLCVQAAGGVQIEVTQHIVIPAILKAWNQPDFDMEKALSELDSELLKVWGKGPEWKDMTVAVWQLRYYSKYIALWHSLDRFRQLEKQGYCKIPKEDTSDAPEEEKVPDRTPAAAYPDRAEADSPVSQRGSHAMLSMDMGGSIALTSQGNTSVILSNGSIQAACPGNLELKAGGTVSIQGRNVNITGGQHVEILSLFGGLTMKARTLFQALCEAGVLWLKGDATRGKTIKEEDKPLGGEDPLFSDYSVVIDASEGKTLVHGAEGVTVGSTETGADVTVQATGKDASVHLVSKRDITMQAKTGTIFTACKNWICTALNIGLYGSKVIKLGTQVAIQKGIMHISALYAQLVAAYGSFIGRSKFVAETNDIEKYKPNTITEELDAIKQFSEEMATTIESGNNYQQTEFGEGKACAKFVFPPWEKEFGTVADGILSLKRSFYEEESTSKDFKEKYVTVEPQKAKLMKGKRTEQMIPFPGPVVKRFEFKADVEGKLLGTAWKQEFTANDIKSLADMTPGPYTYIFYNTQS